MKEYKKGLKPLLKQSGLYILEFSPPPVGGGKKSKGLEMGKEINGEKREKKEIWGKYNFLQYQIIKLN